MSTRTGAGIPKDAETAKEVRRGDVHRAAPFDLWLSTVDGRVQEAIGTTLVAAVLVPDDRPLRTKRLSFAAHVPGGAGSLLAGIYRVDPTEFDADGFLARLSASGSVVLSAGAAERVVVDLDREVIVDRSQAMWLVACVGTDALVEVAVADAETCSLPAFTGPTVTELPAALSFGRVGAAELTAGASAPSARALGRAGSRLV